MSTNALPRLGAAWSSSAATLDDLAELVDFVEAPGWGLDEARAGWSGPMVLHNLDKDMSLADPETVAGNWAARASEAIARAGSPWFSLHLGFSAERVRFDEHMLPLSEPLGREVLRERIIETASKASSLLETPLLLENLDYRPEGAYEHVCEPEFIGEVLEAAGCGLLLDIGHLIVSANWLGWEPEAMLDAMPIERLVEVHVSSPRPLAGEGNSGRLDDVHEVLTDREVRLLRTVLRRGNPRAVVLEYRRDAHELRAQLQLLRSILAEESDDGSGCF